MTKVGVPVLDRFKERQIFFITTATRQNLHTFYLHKIFISKHL